MTNFTQPKMDIPFNSIKSVLAQHEKHFPEKIALYDLDQNKSISWGSLAKWANKIAYYLKKQGIKKGDKIALLADESVEKLIIWMGIWRLGAVVCPLNIEINTAHIGELLDTIKPKLTLWDTELKGHKIAKCIKGENKQFQTWSENIVDLAKNDDFFSSVARIVTPLTLDVENDPEDLSCIFCTSGTTSRPKCVVYNHQAYWLNGLNTIDFLGLTAEDRTLEYRSFGWNSAQVLSLMPWIETGLSMFIAKRFSRSNFFNWIQKHQITFAAGVPTVVNMLLNEPTEITASDIPSLRLMTCSTAPLSPEQWEQFEKMYGVTLLQLYGMSEAGWICGNRHYKRKMGTVGPPAKHQEFEIISNDGKVCPIGTEGEVSVGGPQTAVATISSDGFWEEQRGTRIRTGDLAVLDKNGFVQVTGRTKDLIIRGGVNIAPLEIDHVLMSHPQVREAAAIGIPDDIYGEEVACYVIEKSGEKIDKDELVLHCKKTLPKSKVPKSIYIIDQLPKSDRGKVLRDNLKKLWVDNNTK